MSKNQFKAGGQAKYKRSQEAESQGWFERDVASREVVEKAVAEYVQRCDSYDRLISPPDGVPGKFEGDSSLMAKHAKDVIIELMQRYGLDYFVLHRGIHHYQAQQDKARRLKR